MAINIKTISRVITVLLVALFVWYFISHIEDFRILLNINIAYIVLLVGIYVTGIVVNSLFMKWSIALFGKKIGFKESIRVSMISTVGNFFAPSGSGLAFRAMYLKKYHGLAYSNYVSIMFCNYIFAFFVNALLGLFALCIVRENYSQFFLILMVFFVILLISSMMAFSVRIKERRVVYKYKIVQSIFEILVQITKGWGLILANKKVMTGLFMLTITNATLIILGSYLIMNSLNIHLSFAGLILFSVIGALSVFINITPGNLGVRESVYIIFSTVVGLTTSQILAAAVLDRAILFVVILALWAIYGRRANRQMGINQEAV
jgi:uncharacterized protein (TIRG00374 family)